MVLYDEFGKLLGVSKDSVELFGYATIDDFKERVKDIADFFVKKDGYIYKFEHYNWLDFINYSEEDIKKVLIKRENETIIEATISIQEMENLVKINNSNITYVINFTDIKPVVLDDMFKKEGASSADRDDGLSHKLEPFEPKEESQKKLPFETMMQKYDVDRELYIELLNDFILESKDDMELAEAYIKNSNYELLSKVVGKLKNICINLKLDSFLPILNSIEKDIRSKNYSGVEKFIQIYKNEIDMLLRMVRQI